VARCKTNDERLDPHNGLPLVATIDALFDAGLISFDDDGRLICSDTLEPDERQRLGIREDRVLLLSDRMKQYIAGHRKRYFSE
jgi:putative restriction endonuclease